MRNECRPACNTPESTHEYRDPVSVLTVIDGGAIGLFDGIESLTEAMPGRVSHGRQSGQGTSLRPFG